MSEIPSELHPNKFDADKLQGAQRDSISNAGEAVKGGAEIAKAEAGAKNKAANPDALKPATDGIWNKIKQCFK